MTLVEVLMVVFIAGLVAGFAVLTMPERESPADRAVRPFHPGPIGPSARALVRP